MKKIYKVLLAEDDFASAKIVIHTLNKYNFSVEHAENGKIALDKIKAGNTYDLIITDIMMPEMDGLTLVEKLHNLVETPIIMLTAVGDRENVRKAAKYKVKMFLLKPISSAKIFEKVKEAIRITDSELINKRAVPFRYRILNADEDVWKLELSGIPLVELEEVEQEFASRLKKTKNLKEIRIDIASEVLYNPLSPHHLDNLIKTIRSEYTNGLEISLSGGYFKHIEKSVLADTDHLSKCKLAS
ncbi:MAG: response regulator [Spirochaetota bacterium]